MRVRLTTAQRAKLDAQAVAHGDGCSAAEAVRRLIDHTPIPAAPPVEDRALLEEFAAALVAAATAVNKAGGVVQYAATRHGGPSPEAVAALLEEVAITRDVLTELRREFGW